MTWKNIGKVILFPPVAVLLLLLPIGTVFLVYAMVTLNEADPIRIASYILAFYTLTIWCVRIPALFRFFRTAKQQNQYIRIWLTNPHLRMNIILSGNVLWNGAYSALQLGMGMYHNSAWFYSLAVYYASLAVMRFFLVRHTLRHKLGEDMRQELTQYRTCGWVFLLMNLALSGMMFHMIRENRVTRHHEVTTIALAAYTFTTLTMAIINVFRYRKYNSPALSASRVVSLAAACVSMLTLENTMLDTFGGEDMRAVVRQRFLALSGGAISIYIVVMAICMIINANRKLKGMVNSYGT